MALDPTAYACKCLNICIQPSPSSEQQYPHPVSDPGFVPVFIGHDGISISHPQVTLRTRSRGIPISGSSQCTRYTSLTCLVCQTLVYRVHQVIPLDLDGQEGPQLPTEEWVEQEIMKSSSGWIEVHTECLTVDNIAEVRSLPSFSDTFNIVLRLDSLPTPQTLPTSGSSFRTSTPAFHLSPPSTPPPPPPPPPLFLSGLKPVLPPPPFTPSHPAFLHFSELASERSRKLREDAEQDLAHVVAIKRAHVEQAEEMVRCEVEFIWRKFKEGMHTFGKIPNSSQRDLHSRDPDNPSTSATRSSPDPQRAPVAIRNFTPVVKQAAKTRTVTHTPRVSSLSASMATSSFHHPKAQQNLSWSPPADVNVERDPRHESSSSDPSSLDSSTSRTLSTQSTSSSKAFSLRPKAEGTRIPEPFKRVIDPEKDKATSFRYFTILEADVARQREREASGQKQRNHSTPDSSNNTRGRSEAIKTIANGSQKSDAPTAIASQPLADGGEPNRVEPKGKRKVTFDVKADAIGTSKEGTSEENGGDDVAQPSHAAELIFDIDDEGSERSASEPSTQFVLPLLTESPPLRPRGINRMFNKGLPESLGSLRPASLPLPSHIRPPRAHHGADSSGQFGQAVQGQPRTNTQRRQKTEHAKYEEPLSVTEAELLKLVAAGTPSHRGAWNRDGKAWQLFTRRQDDRAPLRGTIQEESEEGEDFENGLPQIDGKSFDNGDIHLGNFSIAGSLPIAINSMPRQKEGEFTLASYQAEAALFAYHGSHPLAPRAHKKQVTSSTALRKAAYAERDRTRSMDPGALDFATGYDEDEMDDSDGDSLSHGSPSAGQRGRKRALKILQLRSRLPEEGMWRSLA